MELTGYCPSLMTLCLSLTLLVCCGNVISRRLPTPIEKKLSWDEEPRARALSHLRQSGEEFDPSLCTDCNGNTLISKQDSSASNQETEKLKSAPNHEKKNRGRDKNVDNDSFLSVTKNMDRNQISAISSKLSVTPSKKKGKRKTSKSHRKGNKKRTKVGEKHENIKKSESLENKLVKTDEFQTSQYLADEYAKSGLQLPPEAIRLEQRLRPDVRILIQDVMKSMQTIFRDVQYQLGLVENDYKYIFNSTRYDLMLDIRNKLTLISVENDRVYDVVLMTSLLTKGIYTRAHERHLVGPAPLSLMRLPELHKLNLDGINAKSQESYLKANDLKRKVMQRKGSGSVAAPARYEVAPRLANPAHWKDIEARLQTSLAAMEDLNYIANKTMQLLQAKMPGRQLAHKLKQYKALNVSYPDLFVAAKNISSYAHETLKDAKKTNMMNHDYYQNMAWKKRAVFPADDPYASITLWATVDGAKLHAENLHHQALQMERILGPTLKHAKDVIDNKDRDFLSHLLSRQLETLFANVKAVHISLDHMRILIGDKMILTEQCERLYLGLSVYSDLESPIRCDLYIDREMLEATKKKEKEEKKFVDEIMTKVEKEKEEKMVTVKPIVEREEDEKKEKEEKEKIVLEKQTDEKVKETKKEEEKTVDEELESSGEGSSTGIIFEGSADIEDEFMPVTMKIPLPYTNVSTPGVFTTKSASTEKVEGSGDLDFSFRDPFGFFSNLLQSDEPNALSPNGTFNDLLVQRLKFLHSESEAVYELSQNVSAKVTDTSRHFRQMQAKLSESGNAILETRNFIQSWNRNKLTFDITKDEALQISKEIDENVKFVEIKTKLAVETITNKLKEMEGLLKEQKGDEKEAISPVDAEFAFELARNATREVREIMSLRRVYPDPCGIVQALQRRIRSNLTELREKINKAKLIASSIQMAVSLTGSGYLTVPVSEDNLTLSLTTTVDMMIKPTNVDGPVAVIQTNKVASYVLSMKARNPILSILNEDGVDMKELQLEYPLNTSRWYRLHLTRSTNNIDVRITDSEDIKAGTRRNLTVPSLPASQAEPTVLYFGGTPKGYPKYGKGNWQGCLAEVAINQRYLSLVQRDSSGAITQLCQDGRPQDLEAGIVFGGSGYARFPLSTMRTGPIQSINIDFRTLFYDGLIFFIKHSVQRFQGWVSLQAGHILVEFRTSRGTTITKSKGNMYSDGKIHELEIELKQDRIQVSVDTGTDTFEPELSSQAISFEVNNGLYLAGLPVSQAATDSRFRSLHACIRQVHVNGVHVPFALADQTEDVHYGKCGHGVGLEEWASCFKFSDSSTPIQIPESSEGKSFYFSFTRGSLGPIIQYIKKDKFIATFNLNAAGIDISDSVNDENTKLEYDDSIQPGDLVIIGVNDDGKGRVKVSLGKEFTELKYSTSIWGVFRADNAKYSFFIGGSQDSDVKFTGEIINVIIDERPVHLIAHMNENNLQPCTVSRHRPVEAKVREKLVC
ncbi:hypothetical protein CHS0354_006390 [Potamilus streckersoni]|uniref:Laminin G domain-containing protein n=1 Tax=Potamilus streckersoni TaxID=2493646 RepID=A0AAE0WAB0_9BIVA|nr:hypothetical protein CHS0354_006390 [Potamilus streckersoni]